MIGNNNNCCSELGENLMTIIKFCYRRLFFADNKLLIAYKYVAL